MSPEIGHYNNSGHVRRILSIRSAPAWNSYVMGCSSARKPPALKRSRVRGRMPAMRLSSSCTGKMRIAPGDAQHIRYRIEMKPKVKLSGIETVEMRAERKFVRIILKGQIRHFP